MAYSIAKVTDADCVIGNKKLKVRTVTGPASYTTAGEALAASDVGLRSIDQVLGGVLRKTSDQTACVFVSYNNTSGKLVAYWGNAGSASVAPEVTSTTDLSGYAGRLTFIGT